MSAHADQVDLPIAIDPSARRSMRRRALPLLVGPLVVYAVVRPIVPSSTLALGIAGAIPVLYSIVLAVVRGGSTSSRCSLESASRSPVSSRRSPGATRCR